MSPVNAEVDSTKDRKVGGFRRWRHRLEERQGDQGPETAQHRAARERSPCMITVRAEVVGNGKGVGGGGGGGAAGPEPRPPSDPARPCW